MIGRNFLTREAQESRADGSCSPRGGHPAATTRPRPRPKVGSSARVRAVLGGFDREFFSISGWTGRRSGFLSD